MIRTGGRGRKSRRTGTGATAVLALVLALTPACGGGAGKTAALDDRGIENLVRRSYQYVAMYDVNNKFAMGQGGWNTVAADTRLKDYTSSL